jgi:phospholipid-binding lipoprotein MlaA
VTQRLAEVLAVFLKACLGGDVQHAGQMLEGIALDKYTFYRDAYLQRRGSFDDDEEVEVLVPGNGASAPSDGASAPASAASEPGPAVKKPAEPASAATR